MEHQLCDSDCRPQSQSISVDDGFCEFRTFVRMSDPKSSATASGGILATSCWNICIWRRRCSRSSFNVLSREWLTLCNWDNLNWNKRINELIACRQKTILFHSNVMGKKHLLQIQIVGRFTETTIMRRLCITG